MTMLSKTTLASALLGAAALATIALGQANAQSGPAPDPGEDFEKCFAPIKAGLNDCQTASGSCAGTAAEDQKDAWIYLPEGTCERIIGASLEPRA